MVGTKKYVPIFKIIGKGIFKNIFGKKNMKIIEKTTLVLFSTLMLIISIMGSLVIFGWLDFEIIDEIVAGIINNTVSSNIVLGLNVIFILLSIRCIFFDSSSKEKNEYKNGILLENSDGKLLISKETIENLVNGVVKGFDSAEDVNTKIELGKDNTVSIYVNLSVKENAVIKELSTNLQTEIKETIKKTSDLDVKEVNIKVKNIEPEKEIVE